MNVEPWNGVVSKRNTLDTLRPQLNPKGFLLRPGTHMSPLCAGSRLLYVPTMVSTVKHICSRKDETMDHRK